MKKLNPFDISYFRGKNYFEEDGTQNWLVLQPMGKYLEEAYTNNIIYILSWTSKGLSDLEIKSIKTNNYLHNSGIDQYDTSKIRITFNGSCLYRFTLSIPHGKTVNIDIVYEITSYYNNSKYPTIENCLFGSVKVTKNADIDKYECSGYGIGFDTKGCFSIDNEIGKNVIIVRVDMSSSSKVGNTKKDILILGKRPTQG